MEDNRVNRPNRGFGEYVMWFICGTVSGFTIGWLAYLAYTKWPEWWFIIGILSIGCLLVGLVCFIALVAGTCVSALRIIRSMINNVRNVERHTTTNQSQNTQLNED